MVLHKSIDINQGALGQFWNRINQAGLTERDFEKLSLLNYLILKKKYKRLEFMLQLDEDPNYVPTQENADCLKVRKKNLAITLSVFDCNG
jgi:hypothetical protein